jgi:hypothetical protein
MYLERAKSSAFDSGSHWSETKFLRQSCLKSSARRKYSKAGDQKTHTLASACLLTHRHPPEIDYPYPNPAPQRPLAFTRTMAPFSNIFSAVSVFFGKIAQTLYSTPTITGTTPPTSVPGSRILTVTTVLLAAICNLGTYVLIAVGVLELLHLLTYSLQSARRPLMSGYWN